MGYKIAYFLKGSADWPTCSTTDGGKNKHIKQKSEKRAGCGEGKWAVSIAAIPFPQEWISSLLPVHAAVSIKAPADASHPSFLLEAPQPTTHIPVSDLLSHPTLGLCCTWISSSSVRVARQGTELWSGLRAFVVQAGDRGSSRGEEESKVEKSKKKNKNAHAVAQRSELGDSVWTFAVTQKCIFLYSLVTKEASLLIWNTECPLLAKSAANLSSFMSKTQASQK